MTRPVLRKTAEIPFISRMIDKFVDEKAAEKEKEMMKKYAPYLIALALGGGAGGLLSGKGNRGMGTLSGAVLATLAYHLYAQQKRAGGKGKSADGEDDAPKKPKSLAGQAVSHVGKNAGKYGTGAAATAYGLGHGLPMWMRRKWMDQHMAAAKKRYYQTKTKGVPEWDELPIESKAGEAFGPRSEKSNFFERFTDSPYFTKYGYGDPEVRETLRNDWVNRMKASRAGKVGRAGRSLIPSRRIREMFGDEGAKALKAVRKVFR